MSKFRGFVFGLPNSKEFNVLEVFSLLVRSSASGRMVTPPFVE